MAAFKSSRQPKKSFSIGFCGISLLLVANIQFAAASVTWTSPPPAWTPAITSDVRTVNMSVINGSTQVHLRWNYNLSPGVDLRTTTFFIDGDDIGSIFHGNNKDTAVNDKHDYQTRFNISESEVATLIINKVTEREEAVYQCKLTVVGNSWAYNVRIIVTVPAELTNVSADQLRIQEGRSLTVFCVASGKPTPNITWTRVSEDGSNSNLLHHGPTWDFPNINRIASGTYRCTANNGFGNPVKHTFKVNVTYPPGNISEVSSFDISKGSPASIPCPAGGNPSPSITWYRGNDTRILITNSSTLEFTKVTLNDSGWYTCFAKNSLGAGTARIQLLVGKPVPSTPATTTKPTTKGNKTWIIVGAVLGSVFVIAVVAVAVACFQHKKKNCNKKDTREVHNSEDPVEPTGNEYAEVNRGYSEANRNSGAANPPAVPPVTYAVVDKSKRREKKPKPGELQYAELADLTPSQNTPRTSASRDSYPRTDTQYADINAM